MQTVFILQVTVYAFCIESKGNLIIGRGGYYNLFPYHNGRIIVTVHIMNHFTRMVKNVRATFKLILALLSIVQEIVFALSMKDSPSPFDIIICSDECTKVLGNPLGVPAKPIAEYHIRSTS